MKKISIKNNKYNLIIYYLISLNVIFVFLIFALIINYYYVWLLAWILSGVFSITLMLLNKSGKGYFGGSAGEVITKRFRVKKC